MSSTTEKKDLLYVIAHDLQNPITAIKGYAELTINTGSLNEKQQHFVERILVATEDMTELVNNLLDIAWVDAGMPLQLKEGNLAYLAHNIASSYIERAKKQNINLLLEIERVPAVQMDERRMKQVIHNLVNNAIKYSPEGGDVVVEVKPLDGEVYFEVRDQGIGIPEEYQAHIFERFFRVPGDHAGVIDGNGLGLAICYEVLQRHDITLRVSSQAGKGSRFYFSIPPTE